MNKNLLTKYLYRRKATGIIFDKNGEFLIDQLVGYGENDWNFPGGGIEAGESEEQGLLRELKEELGTDKFVITNKGKNTVNYNWPISVIVRRLKKDGKMRIGQSVRHFLVKFTGNRDAIKPDPNEIRKIKWIKRSEFKNYLRFPNQLETVENELKQFK